MSFADRETLHAISLLCHDCNRASRKYLWKRVTIPVPIPFSGPPDVTGLDLIVRDDNRSRWLRELTVHVIQRYSGAMVVIDAIMRVLSIAGHLRSLHFDMRAYLSDMATAMCAAPSFPFELDSFGFPVEGTRHFIPFMLSQPSIRHLHLRGPYNIDRIPDLPLSLLPNLDSLTASPIYAFRITRGRAVQTLDVSGVPLSSIYTLYATSGISASTKPLLRLKIYLKAGISFLEQFTRVATHLRYLEISCRTEFLEETPHLSWLEELEWRGLPPGPPDIRRKPRWVASVRVCLQACPTLKRVIINGILITEPSTGRLTNP
ncbi:hypothetical protein BS47DRAFT_1340100 [Hydnum rufescens UP504]|uniref:F-box domain-containing protein n=1 Tax=Hydnum rufescens UP504 TaxID=1448309 RepID=A0A9P6DZJ4_9AGAM|nr:hypothetical protein BS47DRAFT_1340100 [Hydnum rufescens UP504]